MYIAIARLPEKLGFVESWASKMLYLTYTLQVVRPEIPGKFAIF